MTTKITKYATTIEQVRDDRFQTTDWTGLKNTVSNSNNLYAEGKYTVSGGQKYLPAQIYAHDFKLSLPEVYSIKNVTVEVRIRGSNVNTLVPRAWFVVAGVYNHVGNGYGEGTYFVQPNQNLSDAFNTIFYTMDYADADTFNVTKATIEKDTFGVLLQFNEAQQKDNGGVSIDFIRITVEYEEPEYALAIDGFCHHEEWLVPYQYAKKPFVPFNITFKVHDVNFNLLPPPQTLHIDYPVGIHLIEYSASENSTYNSSSKEWVVDFKNRKMATLTLTVYGITTGTKKFTVYGDEKIGSLSKWMFVEKGTGLESDDDVTITSSDVRCWDTTCFHFVAKTINADGTAGFDVKVDGNSMSTDNELIEWKLDESLSSEGVSVDWSQTNWAYIRFNVPPNEEVEIHWTGCFLPHTQGDNFLWICAEDSGNEYTYDYTSLPPYTYVADFKNHDIVVKEARLVTQITTGAYVYECGVNEHDGSLVQDKSTLRLSKFEDIDYIGCVPLEQTHFDPKSTYKDTLLNTTYKNKTYMGKKGVIDETITLNVRLHPQDVTTMQGLVAMDKPVPINANHLCFEGDALNHRGWCELYGITAEETNPHWYKCNLSVKYITHNLNTRFQINKGSKVSDYFLPELMRDVCQDGDDLTENFYIETNGGYLYSKNTLNPHLRNVLSLGNQKRFIVKSMDRLALKSEVVLNWYSTRNVENVHNDVSRIIRLIDAETENAVLEYEYYDIDFSRSNAYSCRVICRVLYKGAYKTILNRNLVLSSDVEFDPQTEVLDSFGSEVIFKLVGDKLSIQDCGYSGKELYIDDIDLQNGQYYFDVEFKNNNNENDAPDIVNWIDIAIKELEYSSEYSNYYKNILVSPFSVPNKKVVFTRDSEEGTIFYLEDDGTECSYMVNPYYQYHCGVDLQSRDGISIFNLDNNYRTVYITNGLIKLGISRYTGKVTLWKYDKYSKEYLLVSNLQLTKYEDMNINTFTDDKLELQVSDSIITVWRGRPYVKIAHETEDILLSDYFTKIYADGVGENYSNIPHLWSLVDTTNLLSECLGSDRKIKPDCWTLISSDYERSENQAFIRIENNGGLAEDTVISADCNQSYSSMKFLIDGRVFDGTPSPSGTVGETHRISHQFTESGRHKAQAIYYKGNNYYISNIIFIDVADNTWKITPTFPSQMYYLQHDYTCTLTYGGNPVAGETVGFFINGLSYYRETDINGEARVNNTLFPRYEENNQEQPDNYVDNPIPYSILMTYVEDDTELARAVKETTIKKGYVNIDVKSHSHNSTTVSQGSYIVASFTNNLDPEDDDIYIEETYVTNRPVTLSIHGVDYHRITDNEGKCALNINLNPANYDLTVSFAGDGQYNGVIKNYELKVVSSG